MHLKKNGKRLPKRVEHDQIQELTADFSQEPNNL